MEALFERRRADLETEKLDVDFSRGARLLWRLMCAAKNFADTTEREHIQYSMADNKGTREGMVAGVKHLPKLPERDMDRGE